MSPGGASRNFLEQLITMATFYLVRHGDKNVNAELMVGRRPGVHLTEKGEEQARALAAALSSRRIDRIFSSPMERAVETDREPREGARARGENRRCFP